MRPEADQILSVSAERMLMHVLPGLSAPYLQGETAILALLMKFAAREYERGAEIRAAENSDLRSLFAELVPAIADATLQTTLRAASRTQDDSLAISALNAANCELRGLLIVLQSHVEDRDDRVANRRIWEVLRAMAARRALPLG